MSKKRKPKVDTEPGFDKVSHDDLNDYGIPHDLRDECAHLMIPLKVCRETNHYLPWKCHDEQHHYLVCQHKAYKQRYELRQGVIQKEFADGKFQFGTGEVRRM